MANRKQYLTESRPSTGIGFIGMLRLLGALSERTAGLRCWSHRKQPGVTRETGLACTFFIIILFKGRIKKNPNIVTHPPALPSIGRDRLPFQRLLRLLKTEPHSSIIAVTRVQPQAIPRAVTHRLSASGRRPAEPDVQPGSGRFHPCARPADFGPESPPLPCPVGAAGGSPPSTGKLTYDAEGLRRSLKCRFDGHWNGGWEGVWCFEGTDLSDVLRQKGHLGHSFSRLHPTCVL